jgi:hypothetical protein
MCDLAKKLVLGVLLSALLMQPSHAQPFPESDRQKAAEEQKKEREKQTDEDYKATLKRTAKPDKKADPWGSIRNQPSH